MSRPHNRGRAGGDVSQYVAQGATFYSGIFQGILAKSTWYDGRTLHSTWYVLGDFSIAGAAVDLLLVGRVANRSAGNSLWGKAGTSLRNSNVVRNRSNGVSFGNTLPKKALGEPLYSIR